MKSKMNKSKKRMKNKKGKKGNQTVKMRGGKRLKEYIRGDKNKRREQAKQIKQALGKAPTVISAAARNATEVASNAARNAYTATSAAATATSAAVGKAFTATSYEKQFDKKVLDHISGKKDIIKSVETLKETVFNLHSKIEKAHKQLDIFKNAYSKGETIEPKLNAYLNIFSEARNKHFETYTKFINSKKIEELLNTAMTKALKEQSTAKKYADKLENSGKVAQKAVSYAQKAVSDAQTAVSDAETKFEDAKEQYPQNLNTPNTPFNQALIDALNVLPVAKNKLINAKNKLINAQTESAKTAANEFLNNVSLTEATALYYIIEKIKKKGIDKDNPSELTSIFENYKENMDQLIDVKKKMYNQIFKYKNNYTNQEYDYTNQEYDTFFTTINNVDFTQYDNLVKLYNDIVDNSTPIFSSDDSKRLLELANNINKYDLSSFEDLVPAPATPITTAPPGDKKDAKAKAEESKKKVDELKQKIKDAEKEAKEDEQKAKIIDERKITDININFYESNFKYTNPFPYYEQVVLNRTGQDVISDLYGVEELFPTFKDELDFLSDPKKNDPSKKDKFKSFENKNIKIVHKKNDKSAPNL